MHCNYFVLLADSAVLIHTTPHFGILVSNTHTIKGGMHLCLIVFIDGIIDSLNWLFYNVH
jgi:hypothetical protein